MNKLPLTNSQRTLKNYLKRKYGLTVEQRDQLIASTGMQCPLCFGDMSPPQFPTTPDMACIDHCHETGIVRGIICHACNKGIGFLKDSPDVLRRAILHIETASVIYSES